MRKTDVPGEQEWSCGRPMDFRRAMGWRVSHWRWVRRLTQVELGKLVGIRQASISDIENGKMSPRAEVLERIASALDVPLLWLWPWSVGEDLWQ